MGTREGKGDEDEEEVAQLDQVKMPTAYPCWASVAWDAAVFADSIEPFPAANCSTGFEYCSLQRNYDTKQNPKQQAET